MKKYFKTLITNPLFSGSAVMIFGSNMVSFVNYLFHLLMGRLLGPTSYGELATIISLSGLLGIIPLSLNIVLIKYISSSNEEKQVGQLVSWFQNKTIYLSIIVGLPIVVFSSYIASFLNIKNPFLIIMAALIFSISLVSLIYRSALQGLLKFKEFVSSIFFENISKLIIALLLVFVGLQVAGAVGSIVISGLIGIFIARVYVKEYLIDGAKRPKNLKKILLFALPVAIQSITTTSLYSTDLILVKHFFSSHEAGIYASLSTLGKIIFFASAPIGSVMFPFVSKRQSKGESFKKIFFYSLFLTAGLSLFVLLIYWQFPSLIIRLLYGSLYLEGASLLIFFGIFMTLFSLSMLFITLNLSLGKTTVVLLPFLAALFQGFTIWIYHPSLQAVVNISIFVSALLLLGLIIYSNLKIDENKSDLHNSSRL